MKNLRAPMHPVIVNTAVVLTAGFVAAMFCSKVYAADLPAPETVQAPVTATATVSKPKFDPMTNPVLAMIGGNAGRPVMAPTAVPAAEGNPVLTTVASAMPATRTAAIDYKVALTATPARVQLASAGR